MFAKLTTKIALKKAGMPTTFSMPTYTYDTNNQNPSSQPKNAKGEPGSNDSILMPFANPFANVTIPKVWNTWATPPPPPVEIASTRPSVGARAPSGRKLRVGEGRGCLVVFLRWCGCPFAEKQFLTLRALANKYPNLRCVAISHCTPSATTKWLSALGGAWNVEVVVDEEREVYAQWGLELSNSYYLLNPWTQVKQRKLGTEEGIWVREVGSEGGCRWQIGGAWAVDELGVVRWFGVGATADEVVDLAEGVRVLGGR